ncbi:MAG: pyridoxal phosphate-dependent aminotransferase [Candidatus Dadabacteria bacterium]|nr:MAG: pyridoxal phosphate-dependent aminotransferase [Candidatus Dadabacteria bacterium]
MENLTERTSYEVLVKEIKEGLIKEGQRIIDLSMINPDLAPPSYLVDKLVEASLNPRSHRYSSARGVPVLLKAFAQKYSSAFGVDISEDNICATFGTKEALRLLMFVLPFKKVFLFSPVYPPYRWAALEANKDVIEVALGESEEERVENLREAVVKEQGLSGSILLCCFPNNPTGTVASIDFWRAVLQISNEYNLTVINDFANGELLHNGGESRSAFSLLYAAKKSGADFKNIFETYTLSKSYCIPGWRIGAVLGDKEIIEKISALKSKLDYGVFLPLQLAAAKALEHLTSFPKEVALVYKNRACLLKESLERGGWRVWQAEAGAALWAKMPDYVKENSQEFSLKLLKTKGIHILPGTFFDSNWSRWFRFSLSVPESFLLEARETIVEFSQ